MSICDRCFAPGICCQRLHLSTPDGAVTVWAGDDPVERLIDLFRDPDQPFRPLAKIATYAQPGTGRVYSS